MGALRHYTIFSTSPLPEFSGNMYSMNDVKILVFVGMSGSGKTTAIDYLTEKGIPKIYFGGIIYQAMREAGIEITPESQQRFREEIRQKEGKDFVIKRVLKEIQDLINAGQKRIVLDGLYSWTEYKILKKAYPTETTVIAIILPRALRHHRVAERPDRPFNAQEINERDWSELENLEKGAPIAIADYYLENSGSISDLHKQLEQLLKDIDFLPKS